MELHIKVLPRFPGVKPANVIVLGGGVVGENEFKLWINKYKKS